MEITLKYVIVYPVLVDLLGLMIPETDMGMTKTFLVDVMRNNKNNSVIRQPSSPSDDQLVALLDN